MHGVGRAVGMDKIDTRYSHDVAADYHQSQASNALHRLIIDRDESQHCVRNLTLASYPFSCAISHLTLTSARDSGLATW